MKPIQEHEDTPIRLCPPHHPACSKCYERHSPFQPCPDTEEAAHAQAIKLILFLFGIPSLVCLAYLILSHIGH